MTTVERTKLDADTERWLSPMLVVLLLSKDGGPTFARIIESVMIAAVIEAMLDDVSIGARSLDWVRLGQLVRAELGWDHYPSVPPRRAIAVPDRLAQESFDFDHPAFDID